MKIKQAVYGQTTSDNHASMVMLTNTPQIWVRSELRMIGYQAAVAYAQQQGIESDQICLLRAASNVDMQGHKEIINWNPTTPGHWSSADGALITKRGTMTMFQTADCASIGIYNRYSGQSIIYHCGRPAGIPIEQKNIMTRAVELVAPNGDIENLEVIAGGMICGAHFPNIAGQGREQADTYLETYGPDVFYDVDTRALDMKKVITLVHTTLGLSEDQITFFGPECTYAAPCCASHRQNIMSSTVRNHANSILWITSPQP